MNAPFSKLRPGDYFAKYRPQGDSIKAKVARARQIERPVTLPTVAWLSLPWAQMLRDLDAAIAEARREARS